MSSTSERLPSFKGPRDLSLSNRGSKRDTPAQGQAAAGQPRPRRVFVPNIPPKRDKGSAPGTSGTSASTSSSASKNASASPGPRGRSQRGGRGGGRGGAGGRGGRQHKAELKQADSIFSDGIGDPIDAKRSSAQSYRSGYEGGRYRSAASEGRTRMSTVNRNTLNNLIKEENEESNKKIFGTEKFETDEEEETNPENPNVPIVLPLLSYVPDLFAEPAILETASLIEPKTEPGPSASTSGQAMSFSMVRIKQEKLDEDDISPSPSTLVKIKQETPEEYEFINETQRKELQKIPLDPISFAGTFRSSENTGALTYFQFPDELPILKGSLRDSVEQPSTSAAAAAKKVSAELVDDIDDLPEGLIGRFQILSTGRTRFILGENTFDVDPGRPVGFLQELCAVDLEKQTLTNLGPINRKFVITPDIECLITDDL